VKVLLTLWVLNAFSGRAGEFLNHTPPPVLQAAKGFEMTVNIPSGGV